jgi:hypothetical protein
MKKKAPRKKATAKKASAKKPAATKAARPAAQKAPRPSQAGPAAATYTPKTPAGIGWAPFRYPPQ